MVDLLTNCINSILTSETSLVYEIIVVDNNSKDGSVDVISKNFPNVKVYPLNENLGFAKGNNIPLQNLSSKYILYLNPDTIISKDTLQKQFDFMEANLDCGVSGCKVLNEDLSFQLACRRGFPNPWNSFCKLFGLQSTFPKLKLFSGYNLTYKSTEETYEVDALIGAFMFARTELIKTIGGFDEDYFMYGEDLDLCFKIQKLGYKVMYYHETSIIHLKGESTKRSSINEVKHFYKSMEIFAKKNINSSISFQFVISTGITIRKTVSILRKNISSIFMFLIDSIFVSINLLLATYIIRGDAFYFPSYAYPTVFIVIPMVILFSFFITGEYFEDKPSQIKAFTGLMISFFVLTFLTYFFKSFAFGRGILLLTIGFSIGSIFLTRLIYLSISNYRASRISKNVLVLGLNEFSISLDNLLKDYSYNYKLIGYISNMFNNNNKENVRVLGDINSIVNVIQSYKIDEVIITSKDFSTKEMLSIIANSRNSSVSIHYASNKLELDLLSFISKFNKIENKYKLKITLLRYRFIKRLLDILFSSLLLSLGLPLLSLLSKNDKFSIKSVLKVFVGQQSLVGISKEQDFAKKGLITLNDLNLNNKSELDSNNLLDEFYLENYTLALDFQILGKYIFKLG